MTEKELQDILSQVEGIIAEGKGDVCHQVAELIRNIQEMLNAQYQNELNFIIKQINMVLVKHNIDCTNRDYVGGDEIDKYVEENAPDVEILNENI